MANIPKNIAPRMVEYFNDHWYEVGGQYLPSVTTILSIREKTMLAKWRGDLGNREADMRILESQRRGSRIHAAWEVLQNGGEVQFDPRMPYTLDEKVCNLTYQDEMVDIWKLEQFYNIITPKIISIEFIVYSLKSGYAGTVDSLYYIRGDKYSGLGRGSIGLEEGYYLADLKTGKTVSEDAKMQLSAYKRAYNEMIPGTEIKGALVLHTGSKTKSGIDGFSMIHYTKDELDEAYEEFEAHMKLYKIRNEGKGPKVFSFPNQITLNLNNDK